MKRIESDYEHITVFPLNEKSQRKCSMRCCKLTPTHSAVKILLNSKDVRQLFSCEVHLMSIFSILHDSEHLWESYWEDFASQDSDIHTIKDKTINLDRLKK